MMNASRIVVGALLTLGLPAWSQSQSATARTGYTGFFGAGVSAISNPEFNDGLAANGYPTYGSRPTGLNLGVYRLLRNRVMLGGEWVAHSFAGSADTHDGRDMGLGGGYATLGIAYAIDRSPRVRLYPRLGLGVGGMGLWIEDDAARDRDPVAFETWLAAPTSDPEYSTLSQGSMVVDLGAGAEFVLRERGTAPLVGVRFGYVATPFDQGWTLNGRTVTGAPAATVAGPYVRVLFGLRRER
jgi:hypothetical protein